MKNDQETHDAVSDQEEWPTKEGSRRDFLKLGSAGLAGLAGAAALGIDPSKASAQARPSGKKRVTILFDSWNHMMPALAREMVRRNHDLVLGDARDEELVKELRKLGAKVEVVPDTEDQTKPETFQKLVDRAKEAFGGFDSACIRTGTHVNGSVLTAKDEDLDTVHMRETSRPCSTRCERCSPLWLSRNRVRWSSIRAPAPCGRSPRSRSTVRRAREPTRSFVPPGWRSRRTGSPSTAPEPTGWPTPAFSKWWAPTRTRPSARSRRTLLPIRRLIEPEDAASFVATLIDGTATGHDRPVLPDRRWLELHVSRRPGRMWHSESRSAAQDWTEEQLDRLPARAKHRRSKS